MEMGAWGISLLHWELWPLGGVRGRCTGEGRGFELWKGLSC